MLLASSYGVFWRFADEIDVPASPCILCEAATFDGAGNRSTVPEPKNLSRVADGILQHFHAGGFEGYPAQRSLAAPAQFSFLLVLAAGGVFLTHGLHRLRVQPQVLAASRRQFVQVKTAGPALIPAQGMLLGFVTEVPDDIHRTGHPLQSVSARRVFHSVAKGFNHLFMIRF